MSWIGNCLFEGEKPAGVRGALEGAGRALASIWAFLMLAVFPLYMGDHYRKLGEHKFRFFLVASLLCLVPAFFALLAGKDWKKRRPLSLLDAAMLGYLAAVCLSFLLSCDKRAAWVGAEGWYTGLRTQLLLVLAYFCVSRQLAFRRLVLGGHFLCSGAVFLLGILHRFRIDPLGMYAGIDESYQLQFLSTIGQATWYSSYVCTVLAIGVAVFFAGKKTAVRIGSGLYCALGFCTVVTQNSDSAFAAMAFLFFGLFLFSCGQMERMGRFFETLILMLASFKGMGLLQQLFADRAVPLDGLSLFLSQSAATWALLLGVALFYMGFLFYWERREGKTRIRCAAALRCAAGFGLAAAIAGYVAVVWLNTAGRLGEQSQNQYLLFNDAWGNFRGFTWKFTWQAFENLGPVRKLFGVGPDSFRAYFYADEGYSSQLHAFFGQNQILTNAHNEFLNALFCLGILGLLAYAALFLAAAGRFWKGAWERPFQLAGLLAVFAYSAHNFFCYQQVCCTPFLFLILGMAEWEKRRKRAT